MRSLFQARTPSGRVVRLGLAALICLGILLMLIRARSPIFIMLVNFLPVILIALLILTYVFRPIRKPSSAAVQTVSEATGKPKRGEALTELMSILNHEDIEDLRARVKARLEEQIDNADAEEIETFADLLSETKRKRG